MGGGRRGESKGNKQKIQKKIKIGKNCGLEIFRERQGNKKSTFLKVSDREKEGSLCVKERAREAEQQQGRFSSLLLYQRVHDSALYLILSYCISSAVITTQAQPCEIRFLFKCTVDVAWQHKFRKNSDELHS